MRKLPYELRALAVSMVCAMDELRGMEGAMPVRIRAAVSRAAADIASDIPLYQEEIRTAVLLSTRYSRDFPFQQFKGLPISRSDFYRRKRRFLRSVIENFFA